MTAYLLCDLYRPRPPLMLLLLLLLGAPKNCYFSLHIFFLGWGGRERISSCYRLRPSGATPTHLGAKTNTQETRDQTRKYTHTHTPEHTLTHPLTLTKSIEAYFVLLLRRLYFVCVCFNLFLFISLFSPGHKGQSLPHFCLWYSRPFWLASSCVANNTQAVVVVIVVLVLPNFVYGQRNGN